MRRIGIERAGVMLGLLLAFSATSVAAQENVQLTLGGDLYAAGSAAAVDAPVAGDVFLAGGQVTVAQEVGGTAHLAGNALRVTAPLGGGLYAAGYSLRVSAPVTGSATVAAAELDIDASVGGNLRAAGGTVSVTADIAGAALIGAGTLRLDAVIGGDARMSAEVIDFGPDARIDGALVLVVPDPEAIDVPQSVVPPERLQILAERDVGRGRPDLPDMMADAGRKGLLAAAAGFLWGVIVVAAVAALAVALAPDTVARVRSAALERPGRAVLAGFVALSALAGSGFVLALTLIGILLVPAALLLAALAGLFGYVMGSYILGVGLWLTAGREMPQDWLPKAGLAILGAVGAGLIALVPLLGWVLLLGLVFLGLGGMVLSAMQR